MKITFGTIDHIRRLAICREGGGLSESDQVELFDSIDLLDAHELTELYAILRVGQCQAVEQYGVEVAAASAGDAGAVERLFAMPELGTLLTAGIAKLHLA
ncbi:MAG: hypothetical protein ACJ8GW_02725 [Massilia sp.]